MTFYTRIQQIYSFMGEKNTFAEQYESTNKKTAQKSGFFKNMAGVTGLEPMNGGIKTRCLTNLAIPQYWCGRRDLNSHAVKHWNLNPACLPIPPLPQCRLPIKE